MNEPITVQSLARYMEELLPPVVQCSLEDYERLAPVMEREFPHVPFGYSPLVQPGTVIAVHPEKADRSVLEALKGAERE